ncbi:hypothetical protein CCACVL1_00120, partial [Corchorus capsularis]
MDFQRPKPSNDNRNRFSDLPESVILHIFSFMDTIEQALWQQTGDRWMNILAQKHVRQLHLEAASILAYLLDHDFVPNEEFAVADHVLKILRGVCHAEVLNLDMSILK